MPAKPVPCIWSDVTVIGTPDRRAKNPPSGPQTTATSISPRASLAAAKWSEDPMPVVAAVTTFAACGGSAEVPKDVRSGPYAEDGWDAYCDALMEVQGAPIAFSRPCSRTWRVAGSDCAGAMVTCMPSRESAPRRYEALAGRPST